MKQEQKARQRARTEETHVEVGNADVTNEELAQAVDDTLEKIDDALEEQLDEELLADIDDALEENAEQFVRQYVQAGGE